MKTKINTIITLLTTLVVTSSALAGFDITRMTTVVDDFNGSYTVTKSGRLNEGEFVGTTLTEFNGFHPALAGNEANLTGVISKSITRGEGVKSILSDGDIVLQKSEEQLSITFKQLSVSVNQGEVILTGDVNVNEEVYEVNALPEGVAGILRRVFWLTRR